MQDIAKKGEVDTQCFDGGEDITGPRSRSSEVADTALDGDGDVHEGVHEMSRDVSDGGDGVGSRSSQGHMGESGNECKSDRKTRKRKAG